ncbi:hypothetical protein HanIR_Chr01g0043081 [Helianthus annuus]|nr:hypothetical protein HanIR_Chr01g0043081 [Helianthus annuus]
MFDGHIWSFKFLYQLLSNAYQYSFNFIHVLRHVSLLVLEIRVFLRFFLVLIVVRLLISMVLRSLTAT